MSIKVLIADDHPLFRAGLLNLLETDDSIKVVGMASDGMEAIEAVKKQIPDVIVMDISMPNLNGIDATEKILSLHSNLKVLALSNHSGKSYVKGMLDAGAAGYLVKDSAPNELVKAIHKVFSGEMYLDSAITGIALEKTGTNEIAESPVILNTKLHQPQLTKDLIFRESIIDQLENNLDKPLSLVAAPAGYGKSVAVSQWLDNTKALHTWISLDEEHNNLRIFLMYMQAAIEKIYPDILYQTGKLINATKLPPLNVIVYSLVNELDKIEHDFILVLDDYHLVNEEGVHQLINEILRFPPEHMHLCLITRKDPPLKINELIVHNRITEIRMQELSFKQEEIWTLFQKAFNITLKDEQITQIRKKTEGWIVGLRMAFINVKSVEDVTNTISGLRGDIYSITSFAVEEVLKKQPYEMQKLLLISSVLNRLSAPLINYILSGDDEIIQNNSSDRGKIFIQWLIKSNFFIISLDHENKWFRYHHLIKELLESRFKKQKSANEISLIHTRAGKWFEKHGFVEEGIHHMMAVNNHEEACEIIKKHRWSELDADRWYVVQQWLNKVPVELRQKKPELLLSESWGAYENFQLEQMFVLLEQVKPLLTEATEDPQLHGEWYLLNGLIAHWSGNGKQALKLFQQATELLPKHSELAIGMLHLHIGLARSTIGKKELAIDNLKHLLATGSGSAIYQTRLIAGLFYINQFAADLPAAKSAAQHAQKIAEKDNLIYSNAMAICMEATACFCAYDLDQALRLYKMAGLHRYILHKGVAIDALAGLVITYQLLNLSKEAEESLQMLSEFIYETESTEYKEVLNSCKARIKLIKGENITQFFGEDTIIEDSTFAGLFVWIEVPKITKARILIAEDTVESLKKAAELLKEVLQVSRKYHLKNQMIEVLVQQSLLHKKQGHPQESLECMKEALKLGEPGTWIRSFVEAGPYAEEILKTLYRGDTKNPYYLKLVNGFKMAHSKRPEWQQVNAQKDKTNTADFNSRKGTESITARELETLKLLSKGLRNKEIAEQLFVSEGTVKKHIYNLCQKMNVHNRMSLMKKVKELGLNSE